MTSSEESPAPLAEGVLSGVQVLDLSPDIAGSFCARLLGDYGADVLKLEPPGGAALRHRPGGGRKASSSSVRTWRGRLGRAWPQRFSQIFRNFYSVKVSQ